MGEPNLFDYATKELSQDALICWLIKWSEHPEDTELQQLGRRFVVALLSKHGQIGKNIRLDVRNNMKVDVRQQVKGIDVLARINGQHVLLIEDKTVSGQHSDQLSRYRDFVLKETIPFGEETDPSELYPIYFKTGNYTYAERRYINDDETLNYKVFDRSDFLKVLHTYCGNNPIVIQFRDYLQSLEDRTQSFWKWCKGCEKDGEAWKGFYRVLEERLWGDHSTDRNWIGRTWPGWGSWDTAREYLVFWWRPTELPKDQRAYLQLYRDDLYFMITGACCIKEGAQENWVKKHNLNCTSCISTTNLKQCRNSMLNEWDQRFQRSDSQLEILKSKRGGNSLKVARYRNSYLQFNNEGVLDLDATVKQLKCAERTLICAAAVDVSL